MIVKPLGKISKSTSFIIPTIWVDIENLGNVLIGEPWSFIIKFIWVTVQAGVWVHHKDYLGGEN